jgi:hypothetical protein
MARAQTAETPIRISKSFSQRPLKRTPTILPAKSRSLRATSRVAWIRLTPT